MVLCVVCIVSLPSGQQGTPHNTPTKNTKPGAAPSTVSLIACVIGFHKSLEIIRKLAKMFFFYAGAKNFDFTIRL